MELLFISFLSLVFSTVSSISPKYHLSPESLKHGVPFIPRKPAYSILHQPVTSKNFDPVSKEYALNMSKALKDEYLESCNVNTISMTEEERLIDEVSSVDYSYYPEGTVYLAENCYTSRNVEQNGCLATCSYCVISAKLPDRFRPRKVIEKFCSLGSSYCLEGNGSCEHVTYHFEGLEYKQGDPDDMRNWDKYEVELKAGCSCQILNGTPLSEFV